MQDLTPEFRNEGLTSFHYDPIPNSTGNDRAVFLAEYQGKVYKIVINIVVSPTVGESPLMSGEQPVCPPPKLIKVNGKPVSGSTGYDLNTLASASAAQTPASPGTSITVTFADLTGSALGQTNTSGITLDDNASGYGWYIDPTPADNSEFLPTSNPNEWIAKAGSDAAGKMDMLSVLLHEYGHALGINHSPDPNDYMGATLTAGVRRLPSAEEMALMQGLVAQAKATLSRAYVVGASAPYNYGLPLAGATPLPQAGEGQNAPAPFPTIPLGGMSLAFVGLLRSSRYGGLSIDTMDGTTFPQFNAAADDTKPREDARQ